MARTEELRDWQPGDGAIAAPVFHQHLAEEILPHPLADHSFGLCGIDRLEPLLERLFWKGRQPKEEDTNAAQCVVEIGWAVGTYGPCGTEWQGNWRLSHGFEFECGNLWL